MTFSIRLSPQTEARLRQQAAAAGEDPTAFAVQLLERAVDQPEGSIPPVIAAPDEQSGQLSNEVQDFDAALDELFLSDKSMLQDGSLTYSRDDIYFDHD